VGVFGGHSVALLIGGDAFATAVGLFKTRFLELGLRIRLITPGRAPAYAKTPLAVRIARVAAEAHFPRLAHFRRSCDHFTVH